MKANKHLLLWSSLGTLLVLFIAAYQENSAQDWRVVQKKVKSAMVPDQAASFQVQLRQIVAPELKIVDRCVSCHVGMAPGETGIEGDRLYGKHPNVVHDPNSFGCTTCHSGQGRATTTADAHGDVKHWPHPMIPKEFSYAGCGSCHTHLAVPNLTKLEKGKNLFEQNDCLACHKMDGRGGTLRPGGTGGFEGPDLSSAGMKGFNPDWYATHLQKSAADENAAWKNAFGAMPEVEVAAVNEYLNSRVGAPGLVESKALFHTLGCRGCHKIGGVGGDDGPDLTREGEKDPVLTPFTHVKGPHTLNNWLVEHFRNPAAIVPGSQMPDLGLTEEQIRMLTFYMFSLRRAPHPEAFWPKDRIKAERFGEREFSTDGATIYGTYCAACHGPQGQGMRYPNAPSFPAIANPDFLKLASDEFLTENITRGRPGRRMPAWGQTEGGLRAPEIQEVVRYVRQDLGANTFYQTDTRPARWAAGSSATGEILFRKNCAVCHGEKGEGKEGPAIANQVLLKSATDTYLYETIRIGRRGTSMPGFATSTSVQSALADKDIESIVTFIRTWEDKK